MLVNALSDAERHNTWKGVTDFDICPFVFHNLGLKLSWFFHRLKGRAPLQTLGLSDFVRETTAGKRRPNASLKTSTRLPRTRPCRQLILRSNDIGVAAVWRPKA